LTPGGASVQFTAVSNRTYSVQYTDSLNPIHWNNLSNILAHSFTSTQSVADPNPRTNRLYRIVTPIQP
jgi:hypothetical protein